MKKLLISIFTLIFTVSFCSANEIDSVIKKSDISKTATVSVSLRKLNSGHVVYENDSKKLLNPASTLKAFTTPVIVNRLGDDYNFKTQIYKSGKDVYLKLSSDPLLTSKNLNMLIRNMKSVVKSPERFYIDDTVLDDIEYGIGWMWDDEVIHFMPKYSRYNLDGNIYTIKVQPGADRKSVKTEKPSGYNVFIVNNLKIGNKNDIAVSRNFWEGSEKVTLRGTVNTPENIKIPVYNPKRYFLSMLQNAMNNSNIQYYGSFDSKKTPKDAVLIKEYTNPISSMYPMILKDSNNMVAETLFKMAGKVNSTATTESAVEAFKNYYKNIGVETDNIVIFDGSGVSRNDLLSAEWMSEALYKINKNDKNFDYKKYFNIPNEGTMSNRLFELRDYLWAKTGTLANTSGLTGYITTKSGNEYSFAILIQNTIMPAKDAKKLEDEIITTIYNKY